ncbi:MAG: hypothetical protein DI556_06855 [Rhodovulum sulfidophilum]|uniref:HTH araC/xylS-type domain-containing protein n=1 Tax=Rhodovulum sulfidophilum TaxID=35806 RepID=A0A2W5NF49_RHOSU|nr:MAG: hypothetical protein DI556_06855 [Rhodovulum sulfidophilum]
MRERLDEALRLDLSEVPAHRRFRAWSDAFSHAFYDLDAEEMGPVFARGRLEMRDVGPIRLARAQSDPVRWRRRRGQLATSPGGDFYFLPLPVTGQVRISQRDRAVEVTTGTLAVISAIEAYDHHQGSPDMWSIRVPGALLRERVPDVDDLTATGLGARHGAVRLFLDWAIPFARDAGRLDAPGRAVAARVFMDLLALALSAPRAVAAEPARGETSVRIAHRQRVLRFIDAHFTDPELSLAAVSARLGISERYLQRILTERGASLTTLLRARRIDEAKKLLAFPSGRGQPISAIAYSVGFADPAHFSRTFRDAVGESPKAFRDRARAEAAG